MTSTLVGTANLQAHMKLGLVRRAAWIIRHVRRRKPDLLGFQEIGGRAKWAVICSVLRPVYRCHRFSGDASATPTAVRRRRYHVLHRMPWRLSRPEFVGRAGAGPSRLRGKEADVSVLHDRRTGKTVAFANCHLAPQPDRNEARSSLSEEQIRSLVELVAWLRAHYGEDVTIHIVGDFNITDRARLKPLVEAGLHIGPDVADHGKHALSRILSTESRIGMFTVADPSDHDALFALMRD